MKKVFQVMMAFASLLFIVTLLDSCKKSKKNEFYEISGSDRDWDIYYNKKVAGNNISELWSVHIDGTNDHKIAITLPSGWQPTEQDMAQLIYPTIFVLAYNHTLDQDAIFTCSADGTNLKQLFFVPGAEDLALQGYISPLPLSMLYAKHTVNNAIELWQVGLDGTNNHKLDIGLPDNTYLEDDQPAKVLNPANNLITLSTRFEDPVSHETTYPFYKCNIDGSGLTLVSPGESGSGPAIQDAGYFNGILYRKTNDNTSANELWLINLDGTNKHKINISLPAGTFLQAKEMAKLSQEGKSLIFLTTTATAGNSNGQEAIYISNIDGSNPVLVKQFAPGTHAAIQYFLQKISID